MTRSSNQIKFPMKEIHVKNVDELKGPKKPTRPRKKKKQKYNNNNYSRCNRKHYFKTCPTKGKKCKKCRKMNHFAVACRTKTNRIQTVNEQNEYFLVELRETNLNDIWYKTKKK